MSTVLQNPAWDIIWTCCFACVNSQQCSSYILSRHTKRQFTWVECKSREGRGICCLKAGIKCIQGIGKRWILRANSVSLAISSDALDALSHAPGVIGGEVTCILCAYLAFALLIPTSKSLLAVLSVSSSPVLKAKSHAFRRHRTSPFSQGF